MHVKTLFASGALGLLSLSTGDVIAQDFTLEAAPEEEEAKGPFVIYDSEVDVGPGYTTSDSFKFREYNGLPGQGWFAIANGRIRGRAPADSEKPYYFDVIGTNLGLTSRYVRGDFGNQGQYSVFVEYDQIPHLLFDDGATPYRVPGADNLSLPSNWVTSTSTAGMTTLLPDLGQFDVETQRRQLGGGFNRTFRGRWNFNFSLHHEDKKGTDTIGSVFATNGGDALGATLPEPIDFRTDWLNAGLDYAGKKGQFHVGYEFSYFNNDTDTLQFQNAFVNPAWAAGAGFPTGVGEFALPPDNFAHYLVFNGGYNLPGRTRVTLNASYNRQEQNESLLPYTANSLLTANTPVPRDSAKATVNNYLVNVMVSSRPLAKLDLRGSYRYFNRDNNTPQDTFVRIVGDAENQPAGVANPNARINLPYGLDQHEFKLDAGYRIHSRTKLSVGYEYDHTHRDYQEVNSTTEQSFSAKVQSSPMANVSGWAQFVHTIRDNSDYQGNAPFLDSYTPEYLATLPTDEQFENDPNLRKYYLAHLTQNAVKGVLSYSPSHAWGLTIDGNYMDGDYDKSPLGLQNRRMASGSVDVSFSPNEDLNMHAFVTYESRKYDQEGCSFNTIPPPAVNRACIVDPPAQQRQWNADTTDNAITAGFGGEWRINEKWRLGLDYLFTRSTTNVDVTGGSDLQPLFDLPELNSLRHRLGLRLDYRLREKLRLRMSYLFEHLDSKDFALDGVEPNSVPQLITLGNQSPDYNAHVFGISLAYEFD